MNAENIQKLVTLLNGKITDTQLMAFKKRLENEDDEKFRILELQANDLKSPGLAMFLSFACYMGMAYIGRIGKSITWWILVIIDIALPFILGALGAKFGEDENSGVNGAIIGGFFTAGLGLVLFLWWIFDVFGIRKDTKEVNFKKMVAALG